MGSNVGGWRVLQHRQAVGINQLYPTFQSSFYVNAILEVLAQKAGPARLRPAAYRKLGQMQLKNGALVIAQHHLPMLTFTGMQAGNRRCQHQTQAGAPA